MVTIRKIRVHLEKIASKFSLGYYNLHFFSCAHTHTHIHIYILYYIYYTSFKGRSIISEMPVFIFEIVRSEINNNYWKMILQRIKINIFLDCRVFFFGSSEVNLCSVQRLWCGFIQCLGIESLPSICKARALSTEIPLYTSKEALLRVIFVLLWRQGLNLGPHSYMQSKYSISVLL